MNDPTYGALSGDDNNTNLRRSLVMKESVLNNDLEIDITNLIHEVGVPAHIKGYQYLRDAITLVVNNMDFLSAVTKELYPAIASMNNTTPSRVGKGDTTCHRDSVEQRQIGDIGLPVRLYGQDRQRETDQQRVYRHNSR